MNMKKVKRIRMQIVIALITMFALSNMLVINARAASITKAEVTGKLNNIVSQYSGKTSWPSSFGSQCYSFAHFVFNTVFDRNTTVGSYSTGTEYKFNTPARDVKVVGSLAPGYTDAQLESLLDLAQPGDYVQLKRRTGSAGPHSEIVLDVNPKANTITILDANSGSISNQVRTYTQNYFTDSNVRSFRNWNQGVTIYRYKDYVVANDPIGAVDRIEGNRGSISVYGWAYDWDEINTSLDIHVYIGGPAGSGAECHVIKAESDSSDMASVPGNHRFANIIETNLCGEQQVYLYAINVGGGNNVLIGSGTVMITATANDPIGAVDRIEGNRGSISVYGWAYDWDEINTSLDVHVYIGGPAGSDVECHVIKAEGDSSDITSVPGNHRYADIIETDLCGEQQVYLYAINVGGGNNVLIGSGTVMITATANDPIGAVDRIEGNRGSISVYGWAYDWDEINTSLDVHVYIGGPAGSGAECHVIKADNNSPDLISVSGNHRFANIVETNLCGTQRVYLYAINVAGGNHVLIGSRSVTVEHSYNVVIKKATCTAKGVKTYTCVNCKDTKTEEIPATGHQHIELRNEKAASCADAGYTGDTYCKDCNTKLSAGETIAKTGHAWDNGAITTKATCTAKGVKTYTCANCKSTKTEELPATGHQHTELRNAKAATCTQDGYTGDTYCKDCNTKLSTGKKITKTGHVWDAGKVTTNATCTTKGSKIYTCSNCGATKKEEVPATGHLTKITKFAKEASCKSEGYTGDIYCQDCGKLIEEGNVIAKKEHAWDDGKVTVQPTTTSTGSRKFTCQNCGTTRTESIAKLPVQSIVGKTVQDKSSNGIYKVLQGNSVEFKKTISKKSSVKVPDTIKISGKSYKVVTISANAFYNNTVLRTITIGKNVTIIGTNAFGGCKNLSKISGAVGVTKISDKAFYNCSALTTVTISAGVKTIGKQAFYNCKALRTITIQTSKLTSKTVGSNAFAKTYSKPTVKVPAKQLTAYKKLLPSRGMSTKAVYKK